MLKPLLITLTAMLAVGMASADQAKGKVTIPVAKTGPTDGKQMYVSYCAPCHGLNGKGQGPIAPALKMQPTDLSLLSRNHNGKFPDAHLVNVLENGANVKAHGTPEMPVWGPILGKMNVSNPQDRDLRVSNIIRYIETLQEK